MSVSVIAMVDVVLRTITSAWWPTWLVNMLLNGVLRTTGMNDTVRTDVNVAVELALLSIYTDTVKCSTTPLNSETFRLVMSRTKPWECSGRVVPGRVRGRGRGLGGAPGRLALRRVVGSRALEGRVGAAGTAGLPVVGGEPALAPRAGGPGASPTDGMVTHRGG